MMPKKCERWERCQQEKKKKNSQQVAGQYPSRYVQPRKEQLRQSRRRQQHAQGHIRDTHVDH